MFEEVLSHFYFRYALPGHPLPVVVNPSCLSEANCLS